MSSDLIQTLRALLTTEAAASAAVPTVEDLKPLRDRIDAADQLIVQLLNVRSAAANEIGHIKKQIGMPVYVPSREAEVLDKVMAANPGPLPNVAVKRVFERIIDETRSLERQKYQDESDA